jgi:hypothetical protein
MLRTILCLLAVLSLLPVSAASAEPLSKEDWDYFVEETYSRYGEPEPGSFEDELYKAAEATNTQAKAIERFAKARKISIAQAEQYATVIAKSIRLGLSCERACTINPADPLIVEIASVGNGEPSGWLLADLLKNLGRNDYGDSSVGVLVKLAFAHPNAAAVLKILYAYGEEPAYFATLMTRHPAGAEIDFSIEQMAPIGGTRDKTEGWVDAVLDSSIDRLASEGASPATLARVERVSLIRMLNMGLTKAAVDRYLRYNSDVRAQLPIMLPRDAGDKCDLRASTVFEFVDHMAAALWVEGRVAEASALLQTSYPKDRKRNREDLLRHAALTDIFSPKRTASEWYFELIEGRSQPIRGNTRKASDCAPVVDAEGLLDIIENAPFALREAAARRLDGLGMADFSAHFRKPDRDYLRDDSPGSLSRMTDLLAPDLGERQQGWVRAIDEAKAARTSAALQRQPVRVKLPELKPWWIEEPLPGGIKAWQQPDDEGDDEVEAEKSDPPEYVSLPVPTGSIVRHENIGTEQAIIYLSGEYDLPGEIPAFGLWFAQTKNGKWQSPLYLGLQQFFPYFVTPESGLPMLDGDLLQMEVQVREIDIKSISFPPVGTVLKRQQDGLVLKIKLADIVVDSDRDGLTDIEERKLGLDYADADSDGDGMNDGVDAAPLTPWQASTDKRRDIVAGIVLGKLFNHDGGAMIVAPQKGGEANDLESMLASAIGSPPPPTKRNTMFLVASTDMFDALADPNLRFILYSPSDIEALKRDAAPFYPPELVAFFSSPDGATHYVRWSAGWVGGAFIIHCPEKAKAAKQCKIDEVESWIT